MHRPPTTVMADGVRFRIAIPARYGASRLPGKPLRLLAGKPLLEHVYRLACASGADDIVIATDDERVRAAATQFGARVCLTAVEHASGTDRIAELVRRLNWPDDTIVVNLQGDEPLLPPALLGQVAAGLAAHPQAGIATLCAPIDSVTELFDPNVVKVVRGSTGFALYFSRAPIPWQRAAFITGPPSRLPTGDHWWRHVGVYAYRVATLRTFTALPPDPLETSEMLEQLRALAAGIRVLVLETATTPPAGVDTESDLQRVAQALTTRL